MKSMGLHWKRALAKVEGKVKGGGGCSVYQGERYKKVPRGFDTDHKYADLLLNKGLTAFHGRTRTEGNLFCCIY